MPVNIDVDFIFDGRPPKEFVQAIKLVSSGKFKPDFKFRRDALDLGILSDFFAGQGKAPGGLGIEGFIGFFGEPDAKLAAQRGYRNPKSAPDAEFTFETAVETFGEEIARKLQAGVEGIGVQGLGGTGNITAEIKQRTALQKKAETLTQRSLTGYDPSDTTKLEKAIKAARGAKSAAITEWFYTQASPKFRDDVLTTIDQKLANFINIVYVDDKGPLSKPQAYIVPGAAKKLNLRNPANGKRFLVPEFRSGSIQFRLNKAAEQFLEKEYIDVTEKLFRRISSNFGNKLIKYYLTDPNKRISRAMDQLPLIKKFGKDNVVRSLAELIYFASTIDPSLGGKPFALRAESGARGAGPITAGIGAKASRRKADTKQAVLSEVQLSELVRQAMEQRMPKGVPGGPPDPTPGILTYRTGRFVESTTILNINTRKRVINYTYDPIYRVHENTYRPNDLVASTIREVAQQYFGQRYALFRK